MNSSFYDKRSRLSRRKARNTQWQEQQEPCSPSSQGSRRDSGTGLPCRPLKEAAALPRGTAVIYLGWLCAGGIKGLKGARRRFRTAAVCAVGMAAEVEEAKLRRDNRLEGVPLFYLRGGYAPEKLTGFYRAMMAPMARLVSRAPAETEADRAMRDAFRDGGDWVSPERLAPVLAWLDGD